MKKNVNDLKTNLKELAANIRVAKAERKTVNFSGKRTLGTAYRANQLANKWSHEFRLKHIAYCMIYGKTYDEIESNVREEHRLLTTDRNKISFLIQEYDWTDAEKAAYVARKEAIAV